MISVIRYAYFYHLFLFLKNSRFFLFHIKIIFITPWSLLYLRSRKYFGQITICMHAGRSRVSIKKKKTICTFGLLWVFFELWSVKKGPCWKLTWNEKTQFYASHARYYNVIMKLLRWISRWDDWVSRIR